MKVNEPAKTIFCLSHYESMLQYSKSTTLATHSAQVGYFGLKTCLQVFKPSSNQNKNKQVNKNNHLFYKRSISVKVSKCQN